MPRVMLVRGDDDADLTDLKLGPRMSHLHAWTLKSVV